MKRLHLIASRIVQYWRSSRLILSMFFFGGILSAVVFTYFYGNVVTFMVRRGSQAYYYRQYMVSVQQENPIDIQTTVDLLDNELVDSVMVSSTLPDGINSIVADMTNKPTIVGLKGSIVFSTQKNEVIIPTTAMDMVGDVILLHGQELIVIGQHTMDDYYVNYEMFTDLDLKIDRLYVTATVRQDLEHDEMLQFLQESFPNAYIRTPRIYEMDDKNEAVIEVFQICVVYGISLISFLFLLQYLMDSILDHTVICLVVGASKKEIFTLTVAEGLALCAIVDTLGICFHQMLFGPLFSKINISENLVYTAEDYFTVFVLMMCVAMVVIIPFVMKYSRLTPIASHRQMGN